jgi:prepilin peptidase CpaA
MTWELGVALVVGILAAVEDLRRRTISNWLPAAALASGMAGHTLERGWRGLADAGLGTAGGFGVFLIFYLLGGMGGGDIKLMAGFGALLGAGRLLEAALWTAITGGLLAGAAIGIRALGRKRAPATASPAHIPYAPAIAAGSWLALIAGTGTG